MAMEAPSSVGTRYSSSGRKLSVSRPSLPRATVREKRSAIRPSRATCLRVTQPV